MERREHGGKSTGQLLIPPDLRAWAYKLLSTNQANWLGTTHSRVSSGSVQIDSVQQVHESKPTLQQLLMDVE